MGLRGHVRRVAAATTVLAAVLAAPSAAFAGTPPAARERAVTDPQPRPKPAPPAGAYGCIALNMTLMPNYEPRWSPNGGNAAGSVSHGFQLSARPQAFRAPFDFFLDGSGGYRIKPTDPTARESVGRYRYSTRTGQLSFPPELERDLRPTAYFMDSKGQAVMQFAYIPTGWYVECTRFN